MFLKHGMQNTPTYHTWESMKARCNNPNNNRYKYYGAKGIQVCDSWNKFENFLNDMGVKPIGMSLDRIDNTKNYELSNCQWADIYTQNQKRTGVILFNAQSARKLARENGIPNTTFASRIKLGWSVEEAIFTKKRGT